MIKPSSLSVSDEKISFIIRPGVPPQRLCSKEYQLNRFICECNVGVTNIFGGETL
jgi:hypothetical protein